MPNRAAIGAADPLIRLRPAAALQHCLDAIAGGQRRRADRGAESVDYARFDGAPALVVRFSAPNGSLGLGERPGLRHTGRRRGHARQRPGTLSDTLRPA